MIAPRSPQSLLSRLSVFGIYLLFSIGVYQVQGANPDISIDHIAYFKLSGQIISQHPHGDYWRAISPVHTFAVLMAYVFGYTDDNIESLKILLAVMTFAYLVTADIFFSSVTRRSFLTVLFALASAVHLSFGTVFWGMTDFSASLNRSLPVPIMLLILVWYFANWENNKRYISYPILVCASLLHLGSYYLLAVLVVCDAARLLFAYLFIRGISLLRTSVFLLALLSVVLAYASLTLLNLSDASFRLVSPHAAETVKSPSGAPVVSGAVIPTPVDIDQLPPWTKDLSPKDSWAMELQSQPWRNFPPPLATILGFFGSSGFLLVLAAISSTLLYKFGRLTSNDSKFLLFGISILLCSFGLQAGFWFFRHFKDVYPVNFEEVRTVSFMALPLYYLCLRGAEVLVDPDSPIPNRAWLAILALILLFVRPISLVRHFPVKVRQELIVISQKSGILEIRNSQRTTYARQILNLEPADGRFYYSTRPLAEWLTRNASPTDRILTDRDDLQMLPIEVIGTSNSFLNTSSASMKRKAEADIYKTLGNAIEEHDIGKVRKLARDSHATFAIVPWDVGDAVFCSNGYSIIRISP